VSGLDALKSLLQRLREWWGQPIKVSVHVIRSPDWEGDAARYRRERGWDG
jgi:hypothetical protein